VTDLERLYRTLQPDTGWFLVKRPAEAKWVKATRCRAFEKAIDPLLYPGDVTVNIVPLLKFEEELYHTGSRCLWTRVEDGRSLAALRRFNPGPSLVLREGRTVRHVAVWALTRTLEPMDTVRANKRIAHALGPGARKKWCDVDFRLRPPGTVIRTGARPVLVHVAGGHGERMRSVDVVGGLRDAPDPTEGFLRRIGKIP
jgi:hypothetical protein